MVTDLQSKLNQSNVQLQVIAAKYKMVKSENEDLKLKKSPNQPNTGNALRGQKKSVTFNETPKRDQSSRQPIVDEDELSFETTIDVSSAPVLQGAPDFTDSKQPSGIKERLLGKMKEVIQDLETSKKKLAQCENEKAKLNEEVISLTNKLNKIDNDLNTSSEKFKLRSENDVKEMNKKLGEKDLEIRVLKNSQQEKNKKIESLTKDLRDAGFENHDLTKRLREASDLKGGKGSDTGKLQVKVKELEEEVEILRKKSNKISLSAEHDFEKSQLQEQVESLKKQLKDLENLNNTLKTEISRVKALKVNEIDDPNIESEQLKIEVSKLKREIESLNDKIKNLTSDQVNTEKLNAKLTSDLAKQKTEQEKLARDKMKAENEIRDLELKLKLANQKTERSDPEKEIVATLQKENESLRKNVAEFDSQKLLIKELKSQIRNLETNLAEHEQTQSRFDLTNGSKNSDQLQEIEYLKHQIEILESEKEDLEFSLAGIQNQIRAGAFKNVGAEKPPSNVTEESIVTIETVENVYTEMKLNIDEPDFSSQNQENSSAFMVEQLEEQIKILEDKNTELNQKLEQGFANFRSKVITNLDSLYQALGGSRKSDQDDINEIFKSLTSFLKFRIDKKDTLLKELNAENEKLAEKVRALQIQLAENETVENSQIEELEKCKEIVSYYAGETNFDSGTRLGKSSSFLSTLSSLFEHLMSEAQKSNRKEFEPTKNDNFKEIESLKSDLQIVTDEKNEIRKLLSAQQNDESESRFQIENLNRTIDVLQTEIDDIKRQKSIEAEKRNEQVSDENDGRKMAVDAYAEVELQQAKAKVCAFMEHRTIGFDESQDLESLIITLYEDLVGELEREKDISWQERNQNQMLVRRLGDSEIFYDDAMNCKSILNRVLTKYSMQYSVSASLEELAGKIEMLTERMKSPAPIQPESQRRGRSLTKFLKPSKLLPRSKSSQNLRGSQMSVASSYMSTMDSENATSSGIFSDFSKLSTEQLKASLENMHENQLQEVDEIKVSLYEILRALNKAPEYPKPSLQMVKMIRAEIENQNSKHEDERSERERKFSESEMFVHELTTEQNEIHANLYELLNSAGFEPDPSVSSVKMSELANKKVNEKVSSLRRVVKDIERYNQELEIQVAELKSEIAEIKEGEIQKEKEIPSFTEEVLESFQAPSLLNTPPVEYQNLDNNAQLLFEIDMLKTQISDLKNDHDFKEQKFEDKVSKLQIENERLHRTIEEQESQNEQSREKNAQVYQQMLKKLEDDCEELKYALDAEKRKSQNESLKQSLSEPPSVEKISLTNRIKVLETELQKSNSSKMSKESELQEQILSLIDQNTKLIENKKQLRAEIKSLRNQGKDGSSIQDRDFIEEKLQAKIDGLEEEIQTLRQQNYKNNNQTTNLLEQQLDQEKSKVAQLQKELKKLSEIGMSLTNVPESAKMQSLERNLVTANAKLMGQNEMISRLQTDISDMKKLEIKNQQLEMENEILMAKLKENEVEDMTSIRYAFDRLTEDLDIKMSADDLTLAEEMETAFEIIKKRNRSMANKKVTFNPNLTSTNASASGKKSLKVKSKTWPKGGGSDADISGTDDEEQTLASDNYQQIIERLENRIKLQESEISSRNDAQTTLNEIRNAVIQILRIIDGPYVSRTRNYDNQDTVSLLRNLENSVRDLIQQREVESSMLNDVNRNLNSRYRRLEQNYETRSRPQSADRDTRFHYQGSYSTSNLTEF